MDSYNEIPSDRIELRVLGLSYKEIQQGAYALILAEIDGPHYIPIVVGTAEAQSVAMRLENMTPPRPITHDLFASFAHAFGVRLKEVFISKFEDGIFISELTFVSPDGHEVVLDARTSDAIAIAMRTRSPIFTTPEIVEETGFVMDEPQREPVRERLEELRFGTVDDDVNPSQDEDEEDLEQLSIPELEERLADLIADELYEDAAKISAMIKARKGNG